MGREVNRPITFNDAQYMANNEGYAVKQAIPQSSECMTRADIEAYLHTDTANYTSYTTDRLVPYNLLQPIASVVISELTGYANTNTAFLKWTTDGSGQVDFYRLEYKLSSSSTWIIIGGNIAGNDDDYSHSGLQSGETYDYRVRAHDSAGNISGWSNILTITTAVQASAPVITSSSFTFDEDTQVSYQITATNSPTSYGASGLPSGMSINTSTGVISGSVANPNIYTVTISATNSGGTGSKNIKFTVNETVSTYAKTISYGGSSNDSCNNYDSGFFRTYYLDNQFFRNATKVYSNSSGTRLGTAGYYSNGQDWRYFNGSSFTSSGFCGGSEFEFEQ